jgi:hypothetical protein
MVYLSRTYKNLSHALDTGYAWHSRWPNKGGRKLGPIPYASRAYLGKKAEKAALQRKASGSLEGIR